MERNIRRIWAKIFGKTEKQKNRKKYHCLVPGCTHTAIGSHSQQKEGQLRAIARDGQVYAIERNFYRLFKEQEERQSVLLLSPAGLKEASVFPGFCSSHDKALFAPIEQKALEKDDPNQAYCLFLRAFAYEYTQKRKMAEWLREVMTEAKQQRLPFDYESLQAFIIGAEHFLDNDSPFFFNAVFKEDKEPISGWLNWSWLILPKNLGASCSCCFSPLQDQHESYMAEHFGETQPLVTFSLIPLPTETHIVLCWHKQHDELVTPLTARLNGNDDDLEEFINECAIAESEDTCFNPNLWENSSEQDRKDALHAMRHQLFRGSLEKVPRLIKL